MTPAVASMGVGNGSFVVGGCGADCVKAMTGRHTRMAARARPGRIIAPSYDGYIVGLSMPELPEVEAVRRELAPVLEGAHVSRVVLRRGNLRRPFPIEFERRIGGATVRRLTRRAKYLLAELSSNDTLIMHLGMSGSFRVEPADHTPEPHDHVIFELSSGRTVVFNDPRRFGVMDLVPSAGAAAWPALADLGPEP